MSETPEALPESPPSATTAQKALAVLAIAVTAGGGLYTALTGEAVEGLCPECPPCESVTVVIEPKEIDAASAEPAP